MLTATAIVWFAIWGAIQGWFPEAQRQLALSLLNPEDDTSPVEIEIDRFGGSLVDGFELSGLAVRWRGPETGVSAQETPATSLRVDEVRFALGIRELLDERRIHIAMLTLDGVVFDWVESTSTPPTPAASESETQADEAPPWTFAIDDVRVRNGRLRATLAPERGTTPFEAEGGANVRGLEFSEDGSTPQFDDFAVDLRLIAAQVGPLAIQSGQARIAGTRTGVELAVERVQAGVEGEGRLHFAGSGHAHFSDEAPSLDALVVDEMSLDLSFSQLDLSPFAFFAPNIDATAAEPEATITFPRTRLNGSARLSKPDGWQVEFALDPSRIDELALATGSPASDNDASSNALQLREALQLRDARFEAQGRARFEDLAWLSHDTPPALAAFSAELQLIGAQLGPLDVESGRVEVTGTSTGIDVRVDDVRSAIAGRGRLALSGSGDVRLDAAAAANDIVVLDDLIVDLVFEQIDLNEIAPLASELGLADMGQTLPTTRLNGRARVSKPNAWQFDFTLDESALDDFPLDGATARTRFDPVDRSWQVQDARIDSQTMNITFDASGRSSELEAISLDASGVPLATLQRFAQSGADGGALPAVNGQVDIEARLSGGIEDPTGHVALSGRASVGEVPALAFDIAAQVENRHSIVFERFDLEAAEGDARLTVRKASRWRFDPGSAASEAVIVELSTGGDAAGVVEIRDLWSDGTLYRFNAKFDGFGLHHPYALLGQAPLFEGRVDGHLDIDTRSRPARIDSDLRIDQPVIEGFNLDSLDIAANTQGPLWSIESRLAWNGVEPLRLRAVVPSAGAHLDLVARLSDPRTRIELALDDLDVRQLASFLPQDWFGEEAVDGTLAGAFTLVGTQAGPDVNGAITWNQARLATARADRVKLSAVTREGRLALDLDITRDQQSALTANAEIDFADMLEEPRAWLLDPRNRAVFVARDIDLAWLVPRASARRLGRVEALEGKATGRLEVTGSEQGPQIEGRLALEHGQLELALFDEPIGPIEAEFSFDNRSLRIESFVVGSSKGNAVLTGSYRWPATDLLDRVDLEVRFDDFQLDHFPLFEARVKGELALAGPVTALDATGDLDFKRVHVSLPAPQDPLLREVRILGLEDEDPADPAMAQLQQPSAYQSMKAQIAIDVQRGAKVRERGADLEVEGQILLRKRRNAPTLLQGSLATTGGTYTFFGRTFEVREGIATFEERLPPDPELRIEATRRIGDVTVGVRRVGRWSEPAAELFSEPAMEETDILSYLMFNKPRNELGAADDAQLNSATAQVASNLALAELTRALAAELPINEISMELGEDMNVSSVGVETNVGEDIILRYDRALQDGVGDRFTVEWRFWKNLSLRSEYSEGGTSGLDLFWSYEY